MARDVQSPNRRSGLTERAYIGLENDRGRDRRQWKPSRSATTPQRAQKTVTTEALESTIIAPRCRLFAVCADCPWHSPQKAACSLQKNALSMRATRSPHENSQKFCKTVTNTLWPDSSCFQQLATKALPRQLLSEGLFDRKPVTATGGQERNPNGQRILRGSRFVHFLPAGLVTPLFKALQGASAEHQADSDR
jgi:hypothetical protein